MATPQRQSPGQGTGTVLTTSECIPLGDGSYRVVPGRPVERMKVKQAAKVLGVSTASVRQLYHQGHIAGEQPTPRTILLFTASVEAHRRRTRGGGEHWTPERREKMRGRAERCEA